MPGRTCTPTTADQYEGQAVTLRVSPVPHLTARVGGHGQREGQGAVRAGGVTLMGSKHKSAPDQQGHEREHGRRRGMWYNHVGPCQQPSLAFRAHLARSAVGLPPVDHRHVGRGIGRKNFGLELGEDRRAASNLLEDALAHGNATEAQSAPCEGTRPGRWIVHLSCKEGADALLLYLARAMRTQPAG